MAVTLPDLALAYETLGLPEATSYKRMRLSAVEVDESGYVFLSINPSK